MPFDLHYRHAAATDGVDSVTLTDLSRTDRVMLIPVILSGGSGTRLWPLSRKNLPKQFLALSGNATLFQQTVTRTRALTDIEAPIVVCSEAHRFLVAEHLRGL